MALEQKLLLKQTQRLIMTPMLQQAIKLLPLTRLELIQIVRQELVENPLLEEMEEAIEDENNNQEDDYNTEDYIEKGSTLESQSSDTTLSDNTPSEGQNSVDIDWDSYVLEDIEEGRNIERHTEKPPIENILKKDISLSDHLLWQLSLATKTDEERKIGLYLIGNIDSRGYLTINLKEAEEALKIIDEANVERVLKLIQGFDPTGVGARDLRECLLLQLYYSGMKDSIAYTLVQEYLSQLEEKNFPKLAKILALPIEVIVDAVKYIRELNPDPAYMFNKEDVVEYIVPDVMVIKTGEGYQILLNEEGLPRLRINKLYQNILRNKMNGNNTTTEYVEGKLRSALWLIKSIEQRRQTMLKVSRSIVKFQKEFFDKGLSYLQPLVLRDVADDIEMHESTISRVTANKYIHTPQGILSFKFFFHSGIESYTGISMSSVRIKNMIKESISKEDSKSPITDQELVSILMNKGVKIARRTVTKYRKELKVPPANKRKRLFI